MQADEGRREEAHWTLKEEGTLFLLKDLNMFFSEFSCSLCSLLQADEGRREEAHWTLEEEGTVFLLKDLTCSSLNLVVLYALCCRRMKADVKKHI
jgi:hypothetical protein